MEITVFDRYAAQTILAEEAEEGKVRCLVCPNACLISPGARGVCGARFNKNGGLYAPRGYVASLSVDPVEKKPFYHFLPGAAALSFGMPGCNLGCRFCQNHELSQFFRNEGPELRAEKVSPRQLAVAAEAAGADIVASTYNEPFISCEWGREVFTAAREKGLKTAFVSNGYATAKAVEYIAPVLDACNVDLKFFSDAAYREYTGGRLDPVLDTIRLLWAAGVWVEVTTLVIPGLNDTDTELARMAEFCAGVSPDMPWHLSAFHPDYNMLDRARTPAATLSRAAALGRKAGLNYVYTGNIADGIEDTFCPRCGVKAVEREGFCVLARRLDGGNCSACGAAIAGRF